jgi:serine/threonine protein kinase
VIGQTIGPYRVLERVGAGGMGEVYRARDGRLSRDVAIKVMPASFAGDPDRLMRFEREAKSRHVVNEDGRSLVATTAGFDTQLRRFEMKTVWDREG